MRQGACDRASERCAPRGAPHLALRVREVRLRHQRVAGAVKPQAHLWRGHACGGRVGTRRGAVQAGTSLPAPHLNRLPCLPLATPNSRPSRPPGPPLAWAPRFSHSPSTALRSLRFTVTSAASSAGHTGSHGGARFRWGPRQHGSAMLLSTGPCARAQTRRATGGPGRQHGSRGQHPPAELTYEAKAS